MVCLVPLPGTACEGRKWWKTGMPKSYKWSGRHIFTDKLLLEGSYAHVGNNFELALHDPALATVQPAYEISTGAWSRSYQDVVYVRPTDSVDVVTNYFRPGLFGGDHAVRAGLKIRRDIAHSESMYGGDAYARFANIESSRNGAQYAPESTSSGLGNVFVNARWIARVSGSWTLPVWKVNIAAFYNTRQGYPYIRSVLTATRPFSAGTSSVYIDRRGDERLPSFQTLDVHADRTVTFFNRAKVVLGLDVFQALNVNTILSERGTQNASNANTISSIAAPRVLRFGARFAF